MVEVVEKDIDNVRYSFETQEYFQRQLEEAVNTYRTIKFSHGS